MPDRFNDRFNSPDWHPNEWNGHDYRTTNPNLADVAVRYTMVDGEHQVLRFTDWHSQVLAWDVRLSLGTPLPVVAAVIDQALAS